MLGLQYNIKSRDLQFVEVSLSAQENIINEIRRHDTGGWDGAAHIAVVEIGILISQNFAYRYQWHMTKDLKINTNPY